MDESDYLYEKYNEEHKYDGPWCKTCHHHKDEHKLGRGGCEWWEWYTTNSTGYARDTVTHVGTKAYCYHRCKKFVTGGTWMPTYGTR